jgi:hypothetical protein
MIAHPLLPVLLRDRQSFEQAWGVDTAHDEMGKMGSPYGQCVVTSLVLLDCRAGLFESYHPKLTLGRVALDGEMVIKGHGWIELEGEVVVDLTADQAPKVQRPVIAAPKAQLSIEHTTPERALRDPDILERYTRLRRRFLAV